MTFYNTYMRRQNLGQLSTWIGVLGVLLFWWNPAGLVVSLASLVLALVGWVQRREEASNHSWLTAGTLLGIAGLILALLAALQGWTLVNLTTFQ